MKKRITHLELLSHYAPDTWANLLTQLPSFRDPIQGLIDMKDFRLVVPGLPPEQWALSEMIALFADRGQQIFHVGPVLEQMLSNTEVTNVPNGFLKVPFDAFYINFEDSPYEILDPSMTSVQVKGVTVVKGFRGEETLSLCMWGMGPDTLPRDDEDVPYATNAITYDLRPEHLVKGSLVGCIDFEAGIKEILSRPELCTADEGAMQAWELPDYYKRMIPIIRTVINTILYVNSTQAEKLVKPGKLTGPKSVRRTSYTNKPTVTYLGKSYETSKNREIFLSGSRSARRHLRRGHWRGVWVGSKKDEHGVPRLGSHKTLQWIQPTIVNKDSTIEVPSANHIIQEPKQKEGTYGIQ